MKANLRPLWAIAALLVLAALACQAVTGFPESPEPSATPALTATPLPPRPVTPGTENPDEPVAVSGEVPFTSPFFLNTISEPFVMLEDQAGFVHRDRDFEFALSSQAIGPVVLVADDRMAYHLSLPAVPQGTLVDVDNDGQEEPGVQIFAIAYWSNTWGDPFLEERDGTGWSTAYVSTLTDPENDDEVIGGTLLIWSPDGEQEFPTGFGEDGLLFTEDDPAGPVPAGYSFVDLDAEPFRVFKEAQPQINLNEGEIAVNDYSESSYTEAFEQLFQKASKEYPFTEEKAVDWNALYDEFAPRIARAGSAADFYRGLRDFSYAIPDAHVGLTLDGEVFFQERGGSFGLILTELSDGRVLVTEALPGTPADRAGIRPGAEIVTWDGRPAGEAISAVEPYFGPFSTEHHRRLMQAIFLTRVPPNTEVTVEYRNPDGEELQTAALAAEIEYDSLFRALPGLPPDELALPVEGEVLDDSGLGYVRITTFSDDYRMMAGLWEHFLEGLIANEIPGLIIDLRDNGGGSSVLARDFAGYFFDEEMTLYQSFYYNERLEDFKVTDRLARVEPAPFQYEGQIAVLVSPYCISACEGFAYALQQNDRVTVVGHYPTAGAFGEVGRGQYELPEGISMQFPTGRSETMDGSLLIEGQGVQPDVVVPVTEARVVERADEVLNAAVETLLSELR